jgi:hypothetical protein
VFEVRTKYLVLAVALFGVLVGPAAAHAALTPSDVVLGFGASYLSSAGQARTHRGIDLAASPGESVAAPAAGVVDFVGRVPAAGGTTMLAVSLDTVHGRVTLMPLETVTVEGGDSVEQGSSLGRVAQRGDESSPSTHVHLGLRRDGLYLDPAILLSTEVMTPEEGQPGVAPAPAPEVASSTGVIGGAPGPVAGASPVEPFPGTMGEGVELASVAQSIQAEAHGTSVSEVQKPEHALTAVAQSAPARMGEGVSLAVQSAAHDRVPALSPGLVAGSGAPIEAVVPAVRRAAARAEATFARAGIAGYLALVAAALSVVSILGVRAFERRVNVDSPVSDRLGKMLQQLRTGATLRGLTSCPGEAAFTVPGPSSPGEVTK